MRNHLCLKKMKRFTTLSLCLARLWAGRRTCEVLGVCLSALSSRKALGMARLNSHGAQELGFSISIFVGFSISISVGSFRNSGEAAADLQHSWAGNLLTFWSTRPVPEQSSSTLLLERSEARAGCCGAFPQQGFANT